MIVTCPNCSTKFNLPDANATPGAKLRCSVCKHVFPLPETAEKQELSLTPKESGIDIDNLPVPEAKKRKNSSGSLIVLLLLLCAAASTPLAAKLCQKLGGKCRAGLRTAADVTGMAGIMALAVAHLLSGSYNPFLYFRF